MKFAKLMAFGVALALAFVGCFAFATTSAVAVSSHICTQATDMSNMTSMINSLVQGLIPIIIVLVVLMFIMNMLAGVGKHF